MDSFSLKSCFIFCPSLLPSKKKPSDEEIQDAKLLIYYPSSEETLIKRSNIGIIEGTIDFIQSFNKESDDSKKVNNKLFFTELNFTYFISYKFEKDIYIVLLLVKSNLGFKHFESMDLKKKWLRYLIKNFYKIFYLFHGDIYSNFFPDGKDIREDKIKYQNLTVKFSDFISSYFEYFTNMQTPFLDCVLYLECNKDNAYTSIVSSILRLNEKVPLIEKICVVYRGRIVHNEIDIDIMSLIYNMFYYSENGEEKTEQFREPLIIEGIDDLFSPFRKAFLTLENGYLLGAKKNSVFIPTIYIKKNKMKFKLCVYKHNNFCFFLFLKYDYNYSDDSNFFYNTASFIQKFFDKDILAKPTQNFLTKYNNCDNINFVYYNEDNHCLLFSKFFYEKNTNVIDKTKIDVIQMIYEIITKSNRSSVTKLKNYYVYYMTTFEKRIAILLKDYRTIEEVREEYLQRVYSIIDYL